MANHDNLSVRGLTNISRIMSRVPKSLLEEPEDEVITEIDLSMAENWVNRAEVLKILKGAVRDNLAEDVSHTICFLLCFS